VAFVLTLATRFLDENIDRHLQQLAAGSQRTLAQVWAERLGFSASELGGMVAILRGRPSAALQSL